MLHVWVGEYIGKGAVNRPDSYFNTEFNTDLTGTDFSKRLIYECSAKSTVIAPGVFRHPIRGNYSSDKLPTGVKNILIAKYDKDAVINLLYCGDNCIPFLAEIANERDVTVSTSRYVNFFYPILQKGKFKDGVHAMNTDEIIKDPIVWIEYYETHKYDKFEFPDESDDFYNDPNNWYANH